jgi:hypothetical protein
MKAHKLWEAEELPNFRIDANAFPEEGMECTGLSGDTEGESDDEESDNDERMNAAILATETDLRTRLEDINDDDAGREWTELQHFKRTMLHDSTIAKRERLIRLNERLHVRETERVRRQLCMKDTSNELYELTGQLLRAPKGKAVPPWSVPVEIWIMLLLPGRILQRGQMGLGYLSTPIHAPLIRYFMRLLIGTIKFAEEIPNIWNWSLAHGINKNNKKDGFGALRRIHILDPLGKQFMRLRWRQAVRRPWPTYAFGFHKGRRREMAMAMQMIMNHRMNQLGVSFSNNLYDMTNAFASPTFPLIRRVINRQAQPRDVKVLVQRHQRVTVVVQASDGVIAVRPKRGTLQGDTNGPDVFVDCFHDLVDEHLETTRDLAGVGKLLAQCSITMQNVDLSLTSYADDLARGMIFTTWQDFIEKRKLLSQNLNFVLSRGGICQNDSKAQHLVQCNGKHATTQECELFSKKHSLVLLQTLGAILGDNAM